MLADFKNKIHRLLRPILLYWQLFYVNGLRPTIMLDQGPIMGLKIFPDSSRAAVSAYLGVPYAQPPVADLRFAPPLPHKGWNRTLLAMNMRPLCPQPSNTVYHETADGSLPREIATNEDCLYLNIWVSESRNTQNKPVLVLISGEDMIYDWSQNRLSGVDLALDDIVVVSIQYRSNIFGWIAIENGNISGNFGLQDQRLALFWIQNNIKHFGGDANRITLLGHGTTGGPCVLAHALIKPNNNKKLFAKIVIMSSGDMSEYLKTTEEVLTASNILVAKLGCQFETPNAQLIRCLKLKSVSDLLNAFESIYEHGNGSLRIGPILTKPLYDLFRSQTDILLPPILIGITSNEGAFMDQRWINLARESYQSLRDYVDYTVIPRILRKFDKQHRDKVQYALKWFYFSKGYDNSVKHLLYTLQRLISEYFFELPFYRIINILSSTTSVSATTVFAYIFDSSNTMDIRGKVNYFGGASHTSDLLFFLGTSMFQQIARRRLTTEEERKMRRLQEAILNFITSIHNHDFNSHPWLPYSKVDQFIYFIGEEDKNIPMEMSENYFSDFHKNAFKIDEMLKKENSDFSIKNTNNKTWRDNNLQRQSPDNEINYGYAHHLNRIYQFWETFIPNIPIYNFNDDLHAPLGQRNQLMEAVADAARYRKGFFALLSLIAALLSILALCMYFLHRDHMRKRSHSSLFQL
ncbi:cocaine esterase isoform X2 [Eurosta solidaginis]